MRLTVDLINSSLSYLNPLKERELNLRGKRIPEIENLGFAKDHDAIDFTDNDIQTLGNFPLMPRLRTLLLSRNRIAAIQPSVTKNIPFLTTLQLTDNRLKELADLDPLSGFTHLSHLVLVGNPVCMKEHYRSWVIWRCPWVRFFDYRKVRDEERKAARELFGTGDALTALGAKISRIKSTIFESAGADGAADRGGALAGASTAVGNGRVVITEKEKKVLKRMIREAKTLEEVAKLEKVIATGKMPPGFELDLEDAENE